MTANYSKSATLLVGADVLLSDVVDILNQSWRPRRLAIHDRSVRARIPASWRSWGEDLDVTIVRDDTQSVDIIVKSTSSVKTTIFDWGKNRINVDKLLGQMDQRLAG